MDINDVLLRPDGVKRPDHPDFWILSETILKLKGQVAAGEGEDIWRANYEAIGDFDSIAYCAIQCGFDLFQIRTGADWAALTRDGRKHESYVKVVQAFFDGLILGAALERKHHEAGASDD